MAVMNYLGASFSIALKSTQIICCDWLTWGSDRLFDFWLRSDLKLLLWNRTKHLSLASNSQGQAVQNLSQTKLWFIVWNKLNWQLSAINSTKIFRASVCFYVRRPYQQITWHWYCCGFQPFSYQAPKTSTYHYLQQKLANMYCASQNKLQYKLKPINFLTIFMWAHLGNPLVQLRRSLCACIIAVKCFKKSSNSHITYPAYLFL